MSSVSLMRAGRRAQDLAQAKILHPRVERQCGCRPPGPWHETCSYPALSNQIGTGLNAMSQEANLAGATWDQLPSAGRVLGRKPRIGTSRSRSRGQTLRPAAYAKPAVVQVGEASDQSRVS